MKSLPIVALCLAVACGGGSTGAQGPTGPAGPPGPAGPSGTSVVSARFCSGQAVVGINLLFTYQVVVYSNGDKLAICSVTDGFASHSMDFYCRASSSCSPMAECLVPYDVDTPSTGAVFEFRNDAPGERVIYHDPGSVSNGSGATFGASNCG
jgi:hypothetical protein